ncbi:HrcA family transcriptional regulator, partial [Campylobacter sp. 2018MI13]|nr:HrcA family transcriptional regulator [Campylobacter sp. 2018MI13]
MSKKTDFILEQMIKAYLSEQNPIGSMLLQDSLNVPASTIRVYFKQLDSDGYISKLHASGGRIPTQKAMKYYWKQFFNYELNSKLELNSTLNLLRVANENDLFFLIVDNKKIFLNDILNIENRFIILDFIENRVLIDFNDELNILFNQLKGYEINDIKTILY